MPNRTGRHVTAVGKVPQTLVVREHPGARPTALESTVNRLPRLLERVRALLLGPLESGRATSDPVPDAGRSLPPVRCPSPEMWGAMLVAARRRRAPHLWPPEPPAVEDGPVISALVRAYVPLPEQCARPLSLSVGEAR